MNPKYTYLLVDFFCLIFPLLFSFHPKINFYKQWKFFLLPCLISASLFIVWDILFTKLGVWSFNPKYLVGIYFFNLPLEEVLFFLCIPYACVFTYHCVGLFFKFSSKNNSLMYISLILVLFLITLTVLNLTKIYTSVTFALLAALFLYHQVNGTPYLEKFFVSYLLILIPFFISNGILTGSFIDEPVVLYNDEENLGLRMFTIPFEDTFYGMLLVLLNITLYERSISSKMINHES